jgi:hypothetical protein
LSDPTQRAGDVEVAGQSRRPHAYPLGRRHGILAVVVVTAACCAAVLISTPIDISPFARSLVSSQVAPLPLGKPDVDARTPVAAVMSWFAAVQVADLPAVLRLTTAGAQLSVGRVRLSAAVRAVGAALGRPSVIQVEEHGTRAVVRIVVLRYAGSGSSPVSAEPLLIALTRGRVGWQIDDLGYLVNRAGAIRSLPPKGG